MANRYRGAIYVGVTAGLTTRIDQHHIGDGSDHCRRCSLNRLVRAGGGESIEDCIAHEKRVNR